MTIESNDPLRDLWQDAGFSTPPREVDVEAVKKRSLAFAKTIGRRNLRETLAAALVVASFGAIAFVAKSNWERAGALCIALAAIWVTRTILREGKNPEAPLEGETQALLRHERDAIDRQIALLSRVRSFYLAPFLPGLALFMVPSLLRDLHAGSLHGFFRIAGVALVFYAIAKLNDRAVVRLRALRSTLVGEGE